MSHVLVMGGSSGIGLETVKTLLDRDHDVIAFSRGAKNLRLNHPKLVKISGDATNGADVRNAINDADVVIQALGVPVNFNLLIGPIHLFSSATKTLIPIMEEKAIKRLIAVTGFGAGSSNAAINCVQRIFFNAIFGHAYRDKSGQETLIKKSGLNWTIVRPGILTNGSLKGQYKVRLKPSDWRNGTISRAAVADYIATAIDDDATIGEEPVLAN